VKSDELFAGKKVVVFALPGAFTPTCSAKHLPGFIQHAAEIKQKGVDAIACVSVNDVFVMGAWGEQQGAGDKVMMLADGNGELTAALVWRWTPRNTAWASAASAFRCWSRMAWFKQLNVEGVRRVLGFQRGNILKQL